MAEQKLLDKSSPFSSFGLDSRLLRALSKLNYTSPTLVQSKAIPLALSGKDILARARTGSGKTAAYCIPVVHKILTIKESIGSTDPKFSKIRSLILVPTRELSEQVTSFLNSLLLYASKDIKIINLVASVPTQLQKPLLSALPDIVVSTPSRVLAHLESGSLSLRDSLEILVIDEADLVLSYGYDEDLRNIIGHLPKIFQSFLMSATLGKDVEDLKQLILRNPAILKLEEEEEPDLLTQYIVKCSEHDKFLLTYVIFRLKLIKGKAIIFVADIERCYRLKLFLEQFSIKTCVVNSELPINSRYHIVQEFNKGIYDYIIATDEANLKGEQDSDDEEDKVENMELERDEADIENGDKHNDEVEEIEKGMKIPENGEASAQTLIPQKRKKTQRKHRQDKEYGVSRGVDFQNASAVINFDFPTTAKSYTHRVGRTARGGERGMSLSFIVTNEEMTRRSEKDKAIARTGKVDDEKVLERVERIQKERGAILKPYQFDMAQIEGFRYRMEDALRAVTRTSVHEARLKELKQEILHSERLKAHFEDNPKDLNFLRHDRPLHPARVQQHMRHVPRYLMPKIAAPSAGTGDGIVGESEDYIPFHKPGYEKKRRGNKSVGKRRKHDPLKTFSMVQAKMGKKVRNPGPKN